MSDWGSVAQYGQPISAWEFRARYLAFGEKYEMFYCPFCNIRLAACLIYLDGELTKSPHFSARWGGHLLECDGEPLQVDEPKRKPASTHYTSRLMHAPEELIGRPQEIGYLVNEENPNKFTLNPVTASAHMKQTALSKPTPRTYLIQPIVEAFSITLSTIYNIANECGWDVKKRKIEIKKALTVMPLKLVDLTNYDDAFRSAIFLNFKYPRIYHGVGSVEMTASSYAITNKCEARVDHKHKPFRIFIQQDCKANIPKSHAALLYRMSSYALSKKEIKWYAYGMPEMHADYISLVVRNLDYIYIKDLHRQ